MESWILHHPEYTWPNPSPKQSILVILVILVILISCMTIAMAIFHLENWIPDVKAHGFRILRFLGRGQYGTAWGSSVNTPRMPDFLLGPGTANFLFYWCDACSMRVIICNIQYIYVIHWLFAIYWYIMILIYVFIWQNQCSYMMLAAPESSVMPVKSNSHLIII